MLFVSINIHNKLELYVYDPTVCFISSFDFVLSNLHLLIKFAIFKFSEKNYKKRRETRTLFSRYI